MSGKLKQIKDRIKSLKSTNKITKAMELIASTNLRGQKKILNLSIDYYNQITELYHKVSFCQDGVTLNIKENNIFKGFEGEKTLLIAISPDKGLCGGINSTLEKKIEQYIYEFDKNNLIIITIGKKINDYLIRHHSDFNIISCENNYYEKIENFITLHKLSKIDILYTHFNSIMHNEVKIYNSFPLNIVKNSHDNTFPVEQESELILECVSSLILKGTLNYCVSNAKISEIASRMLAMDSATKNSKKMIDKLTLDGNKIRQTKITNDLIDVISGAKAISG